MIARLISSAMLADMVRRGCGSVSAALPAVAVRPNFEMSLEILLVKSRGYRG